MAGGMSRNHLCKCGSGLKAKLCCILRAEKAHDKLNELNRFIFDKVTNIMKDYGVIDIAISPKDMKYRFLDCKEEKRIVYLKNKFDIAEITPVFVPDGKTRSGLDKIINTEVTDFLVIVPLLIKKKKGCKFWQKRLK